MMYLRMQPMDLIASVAFLQVSFMWYLCDRFFLSKLTPRSQTLSVSSMNSTVLAKESLLMLGFLVNRDVNSITSVFSAISYFSKQVIQGVTCSKTHQKKAVSCLA